MIPRFYFTAHASDMTRVRLPEGAHLMLVASAHWDNDRQRFRINRPPAGHFASVALDSGGFTAARRWGQYPWTPAQYADWIQETSRDMSLDFCAIMDYACEPTVNRSIHATNRKRIDATHANEAACREAAPNLPWLSVLQGDSLEERAYEIDRRTQIGLPPSSYAGIGSVCGRGVKHALQVIDLYALRLPEVRLHGFGLHVQVLDDDRAFSTLASWDTYGWNWGRGQKEKDRPPEYLRKPGESYSRFTRRLAELYLHNTVYPRLHRRHRQLALF